MGERPLSEVPAKKRGRYKRRLEMFELIRQRLQPWRASHGRDPSHGPAPRQAVSGSSV